MKLRRDHRILAATAVLAVGVPVGAAIVIDQHTQALADHLGTAGGVRAQIGAVDASLTGTVRLSDVALGSLLSADEIEASVALDSLLAGHASADEIRVAGPHLAVTVDRDGDSDLARLVRKLAHAGPARGGSGGTRVRRIVVSSGTMTAKIAGIGELSADDVELVPDAGGVRVITGKLRLRGESHGVAGELVLSRAAAEVALPRVQFGRVLGVAGTGSVTIGDRALALHEVSLGRLAPHGNLEAHGVLDDAGVPRPLTAVLAPATETRGVMLALRGERIPLAPFESLAPRGVLVRDARVTGELALAPAREQVRVAVTGSIAGLRLDHPTLAPQPVPFDGSVDASLALGRDAISVERAALTVGTGAQGGATGSNAVASWTVSGWIRRTTPLAGTVEVALADAPCMDLLHSLPVELRGPLDGIAMTGTFGGRAKLTLDLAAPVGEGVVIATELANRCAVATEPPAADVTTLAERPAEGDWVATKRLPSYIKGAFVSAEDGRFYEHDGFDVEQIARSLEIDLRDRRLARGGSTISQQLVKNAFLTHRRSFDRKVQEAVLTWRLEDKLEKRTILERYLNIIELGPRVHGLKAASWYWFDIDPGDLSIRQAAFLAALTAEPQSMGRRVRKAGGLDPASAERVETILRAMRRDGVIDKDELDAARDAPMRFSSAALRRDA